MSKAIKLCTDGHIDIVEVSRQRSLLSWLYREIGCDCIENVYPRGLKDPYMMVIDGEGLLKDSPVINYLGSYLYETQKHGSPIVGTVLVMQKVWTSSGPDIGGIPDEDAHILANTLGQKLPFAIQAINKKLGNQIKR